MIKTKKRTRFSRLSDIEISNQVYSIIKFSSSELSRFVLGIFIL